MDETGVSDVSNADDEDGEDRRALACAVRLLARRDHSATELVGKLRARGFAARSIERAIAVLGLQGAIDDTRVARLLAEQRYDKGYGPIAIRHKLLERGFEPALAERMVDALEVDWNAAALALLERRFPAEELAESDSRLRARVARLLRSRGFPSAIALRALEMAERRACLHH